MKYTPRQITMDLAELQALESELDSLKTAPTGEELTEIEHQEATGILLTRSVQNPNLFRTIGNEPINLGKYKAIFTFVQEMNKPAPTLRVKFVRTQ